MLDVKAVGFSSILELFVVVVVVIAYVLNAMGEIVEVRHFMEHGRATSLIGRLMYSAVILISRRASPSPCQMKRHSLQTLVE